jgi:monoamine oxidase
VVVGAGLAGLRAALTLRDAGLAPIVLEAGHEVGGRVRSSHLPNGSVIELGAEWIMPGDTELRALAARLDVDLVPTRTDYRRRTPAGTGAPSFAAFAAGVADVARRRSELDGELASLSAATFFDRLEADPSIDAAAVHTLRMRLQGTSGLDLSRLPVSCLDAEDLHLEPAVYERVAGGNQRIPLAAADDLPDVRLRHRVLSVHSGNGGVRVIAERGDGHRVSVDAEVVVIAVPVPLVDPIAFDPPLAPDVREAFRVRPFGIASKLSVAIAAGAAPRSLQSAHIPMWCWVSAGEGGVSRPNLTAFCGSPEAHEALELTSGDPSVWLARLGELAPDLGFEGRPRLQRWSEEPFVRGAYSGLDGPSLERLPLLQRPVGRLVFAGEHTADPDHVGTMEGAVRSGTRAASIAREILG